MENICAENFVRIFSEFENRLNAVFQRNTKLVEGGSVRISKQTGPYKYRKNLVSKDGITIEIRVFYDKIADDYLYYSYNIFFENNKLMFHYEPTHKEHFQPHINVYIGGKELQNAGGEGIHIISHKYHPLEILSMTERYFV
ncbi:MAG: hypothetical protein BWK80_25625 [Desulfobacteraceae bacterium IS3]|nr:MAG: hypothetical protein BWK80_25625 [Desulfobacteraceae bacterium IS3]